MGRSGSERETKWTPGPWIIESREDVEMELDGWGDAICCDVDNEDRYIAEMIGDRPADARLIAAAPDMADELQRLYERYGWESTRALLARILPPDKPEE